MKYFTLLGGFSGFALTFSTALAAGTDAGFALRDATVGCLVGGALFRGFRRVMGHHARQLLAEKARQHQSASAQAAA